MRILTSAEYDHLEQSEKNAYDAEWQANEDALTEEATEDHNQHAELGESDSRCLICQGTAD
jgi:hypothetical protein